MNAVRFKSQKPTVAMSALKWTTSSIKHTPPNKRRVSIMRKKLQHQTIDRNNQSYSHVYIYTFQYALYTIPTSVIRIECWTHCWKSSIASECINQRNQCQRSFPAWKKKFSMEAKKMNSCYFAERENGEGRKMVLAWTGRGTESCSEGWRWQEAAERDRERERMSPDSWTMRTAMPGIRTDQKSLQNGNEAGWRTVCVCGGGGANVQLGSLYGLKLPQRDKDRWNVFHRRYRESRDRPLSGRRPYLGWSRRHRSCCRDASLDCDVTAWRCHGNCDRCWEEGRYDWEGKEPWTVVAIDNGRGTAMIGSPIVEACRTDVSPLPRPPVVPLKAVVVAWHHFLVLSEGMTRAGLSKKRGKGLVEIISSSICESDRKLLQKVKHKCMFP